MKDIMDKGYGAALSQPDYVQTLIDLVSIYSPSGEEANAVDYLVERMKKLGYSQSYSDEAGNAIGIMGNGPKQVVLLGHIDTVPGKIPVCVEDDVLFGRGSVDSKGPLAAFVEAAARVGEREGWQIVVIGAVDEERDSSGARACVGFFSPDYAIIGEPSRWSRVTLGYKGSAATLITVRQDLFHNASGVQSACEAAFQVWKEIREWVEIFNNEKNKLFDSIAPSLRGLASGSDGFEEWASLEIDARLPPDLPPTVWYQHLQELFPDAGVESKGHPIPAYRAGKNNRLVREFLRSIRNWVEPGFVLKSGTSDMNVAGPVWNCPILAYGPGDSALDHTPHEHLSLKEYSQSVEILEQVLSAICGSRSP